MRGAGTNRSPGKPSCRDRDSAPRHAVPGQAWGLAAASDTGQRSQHCSLLGCLQPCL